MSMITCIHCHPWTREYPSTMDENFVVPRAAGRARVIHGNSGPSNETHKQTVLKFKYYTYLHNRLFVRFFLLLIVMSFSKEYHINYFLGCLSGLNSAYCSLDATRLTVVYFSVIALDTLGALDKVDKNIICNYIYGLQIGVNDLGQNSLCKDCSRPSVKGAGGFLGGSYLGTPFREYSSSTTATPGHDESCQCISFEYMQGHLAMAYTSLATLITLGDDLSRLDRITLLKSIKYLQLSNGSFRATNLGTECDMRFVYCACAISYMLGDWNYIDINSMLTFIKSCQTYEGGFSLIPNMEAQGGATYCAIASLTLCNKLHDTLDTKSIKSLESWCERRALDTGGYNGRTNKVADSCYSFWIGGTMQMLDSFNTDPEPILSFLLNKCQFLSGGFGKTPGDYPDVLHSFYSLSWLAINQDISMNLKPFYSPLGICFDRYARINKNKYYTKKNVSTHEYDMYKHVYEHSADWGIFVPKLVHYDNASKTMIMEIAPGMNVSDMYGEEAESVPDTIFNEAVNIIKILKYNNVEYPDITGYNFIEDRTEGRPYKIWIIDFEHSRINSNIDPNTDNGDYIIQLCAGKKREWNQNFR